MDNNTASYLEDLPVKPGINPSKSSNIISTYMKEMNKISTVAQLKDFTDRWAHIWNMRFDEDDTASLEERHILDGTLDYAKVFSQLEKMRQDNSDIDTLDARIASVIIMPKPFLIAMLTSQGLVGTDEGLMVLYARSLS